MEDGTRIQVVGIVEDGKYTANLAENPQAATFLPILQSPSNDAWMVVRSSRDPRQLAAAIWGQLRNLDAALPVFIQTWNQEMSGALFAPRMATLSLGVLGLMGAVLSITGIFGMAAYSVSRRKRELAIRIALGAHATKSSAPHWAARSSCRFRFGGRIDFGISRQPGAGGHRISGNAARSSGACRSGSGYGIARAGGYLDSSATHSVARSDGPVARGVNPRPERKCISAPPVTKNRAVLCPPA